MLRRSLGAGRKQDSSISDVENESTAWASRQETQLEQLQRELSHALERSEEAEACCSHLQDELRAVHVDAELRQFRAIKREREKWVEQERRWLAQLATLVQVIE